MPLLIEELNPGRHDRRGFDCGFEPLNHYLHALAAQHRAKGIATTFVLVDDATPAQVLGYYTLSAATLVWGDLAQTDRRRLPAYPVPVARMGRLAVALAARNRRFGELLLQNAVKRLLAARETLGVYALVVDAKDDTAAGFYRKYGFRHTAPGGLELYLPLGRG